VRCKLRGTTVFSSFDVGRCDVGDPRVFGRGVLVCNEQSGLAALLEAKLWSVDDEGGQWER